MIPGSANPLLLADAGYQIQRSLRFRSSASAYLSRTPAVAGNRKTWTWGGWVKIGADTGSNRQIFASTAGGSTNATSTWIGWTGGFIFWQAWDGQMAGVSPALFRDPSAWYHLVLQLDTTNATAADRIKTYLNGVRQAMVAGVVGYPALNADLAINTTQPQDISGRNGGSLLFDGYLSEINFIDGQALTPASFGEFSPVTGQWQAKKYAGTYGTNGFYLPFTDNSAATATAIGADKSGNGNNWTPNNISLSAGATYDSMLDVPLGAGGAERGNYAVVSPVDKAPTITVSNGNLTASYTGATDTHKYRGTIECPVGSWYWEVAVTTDNRGGIGVGSAASPLTAGGAQTYTYHETGKFYINSVDQGVLFSAYAVGDVIGVAMDTTANTVRWYKNGVAQGSVATSLSSSFTYFPTGSLYAAIHNYNFGQRPFAYTPPTGFRALHTGNLPDPVIKKPSGYFDVVTRNGSSASQTIAGIGFQPDLVWNKSRSHADNHVLIDSVRGITNYLSSDLTSSDTSDATRVTSLNSDGVTFGASSGVNLSGRSYVDWLWKAGGAAVANNAGSIASQVSAGVTQGFSIVTYTGTGAAATVGHGLGVAPKLIIVKNRTSTQNWLVYYSGQGASRYGYLNLTNPWVTDSTAFNGVTPTSAVFSVGTALETNGNTNSLVAYCFSEVAGFSKFGSYVGNGIADGPFVYCGFRPRFVMIKRTDTLGDWVILDAGRGTYNLNNLALYPNRSVAEESAYMFDFVSNGFKPRDAGIGQNASGGTYIFMAFAETPFKNSLAR